VTPASATSCTSPTTAPATRSPNPATARSAR
jgi:hypothetical protein